ncbi:hypothetical protein ABET52_04200 [Saccharococcus caldoxylosilyticus]|uniref:hypothetical protein n=1 Tax=Saccharococcus caldoxylosilyticus TaxID=81408 RepID=UPI000779BFBE|nr:hypothetical protein [Parageobacillus caldoxylosilyticus]QXJ38809.1 hypothetical protein BV455_02153 [Parageobacillus caldoxylosilyticus]
MSSSKKTVNFKYVFADDYNPVYVNGAHGGISPQGEIVINFYFERRPLPYEEIYKFDEKGQPTGEIEVKPSNHNENIIRYVSTGIVMNLESAKIFHEWLREHIIMLEQIRNEGAKS